MAKTKQKGKTRTLWGLP